MEIQLVWMRHKCKLSKRYFHAAKSSADVHEIIILNMRECFRFLQAESRNIMMCLFNSFKFLEIQKFYPYVFFSDDVSMSVQTVSAIGWWAKLQNCVQVHCSVTGVVPHVSSSVHPSDCEIWPWFLRLCIWMSLSTFSRTWLHLKLRWKWYI